MTTVLGILFGVTSCLFGILLMTSETLIPFIMGMFMFLVGISIASPDKIRQKIIEYTIDKPLDFFNKEVW